MIKVNLGVLCWKIDTIWIGILELGIFKVKSVNQKKFSTWRMKEEPEKRWVLPAGSSFPIYSSLRQGWMHVWTSISSAEWFPKKTTDKNIIWILDHFWRASVLIKNLKKKDFGNCKGLNSASFHLKEKLPFPFKLLGEFQSFLWWTGSPALF